MNGKQIRHFGMIETYEPEKLQRFLGYISGYLEIQCNFHAGSFLDWDGKFWSDDAPVVGQRVSFLAYRNNRGEYLAEEVRRESNS